MATLLEKANQILDEKNAKILPENIKEGVQIFDIVGSLEQLDTSDADATSTDIVRGKTAYVNGEKITGSIEELLAGDTFNAGDVISVDEDETYLNIHNNQGIDRLARSGVDLVAQAEKGKVVEAINLTPEKIVKGNIILGVEGTAEAGGSDGVKLFETQEEMQADPTAQEGDLAVVYRSELKNATVDSKFQTATFPQTVVLDTAITDYVEVRYRAVDSSKMFDCMGQLDSSRFMMDCYSESGEVRIQYTSSDGITYTRTDSAGNPVDFGCEIYYEMAEMWNDAIGKFIQVGGNKFEGLYEYKCYIDTNLAKLPLLSSCIVSGSNVNFGGEFCDTSIDLTNLSNLIHNWSNNFAIPTYINFVCSDSKWYILVPYKDNECLSEILYTAFNTDGTYNGVAGLTCNKLKRFEVQADEIVFIDDITPTHTVLRDTTAINAFLINDIITISNNYNTTSYKFNGACNYIVSGNYNRNFEFNVTDESFVSNYVFATTQLSATPEYVYEKEFYGKNGIENGTLTQGISNSFDDTNAAVYGKIQNYYDTLEPRVLTDSDKTINKNICYIPVKNDGTLLLDTSKVTNMGYMFQNCKNLTAIPLLDTSRVTNMSDMFVGCTNLAIVPQLDTSKVTNMGYMFNSCKSLTTIPLLNTSNVTEMGVMFGLCTNLTSIPQLDTSKVTNMSSMFSGCVNLTEIPQLDTSKVTNMYNMFGGCTNLTTIPQLNTSSVTRMDYMFSKCTNLTDESLNNILAMCKNATSYTGTKTLKYIGLTSAQATKCQSLSNYSAFTSAGWTTGY